MIYERGLLKILMELLREVFLDITLRLKPIKKVRILAHVRQC